MYYLECPRHVLVCAWPACLGQSAVLAEVLRLQQGSPLLSVPHDKLVGGFSGTLDWVCLKGGPEVIYIPNMFKDSPSSLR